MLWPNGKATIPTVTSEFNPSRLHPVFGYDLPHNGIDIVGFNTIRVVASGTVIFSGRNQGAGLQVSVRHANGLVTRYKHLSKITVEVGDVLKAGDAVGLMGMTGTATGVHLHFETVVNGVPVNPRTVIGVQPAAKESIKLDIRESDMKVVSVPHGTIAVVGEYIGATYSSTAGGNGFSIGVNRKAYGEVNNLTEDEVATLLSEAQGRRNALIADIAAAIITETTNTVVDPDVILDRLAERIRE